MIIIIIPWKFHIYTFFSPGMVSPACVELPVRSPLAEVGGVGMPEQDWGCFFFLKQNNWIFSLPLQWGCSSVCWTACWSGYPRARQGNWTWASGPRPARPPPPPPPSPPLPPCPPTESTMTSSPHSRSRTRPCCSLSRCPGQLSPPPSPPSLSLSPSPSSSDSR